MLPILATALLARGASALVCRKPVYKALADRLLALMPEPVPPAKDGRDDDDADGPRPAHT